MHIYIYIYIYIYIHTYVYLMFCVHIKTGGYYLYLNNTSPPHRDNIALLVSLPISSLPGKYRCLHFWYHMSGQDRDCCHLQVRVYQVDNSLTGAVWNKMGDVRSAWKEAFINLNIGDPFQVDR